MIYLYFFVNQRKRSLSKKVCHTFSKAKNWLNIVLVGGIQVCVAGPPVTDKYSPAAWSTVFRETCSRDDCYLAECP